MQPISQFERLTGPSAVPTASIDSLMQDAVSEKNIVSKKLIYAKIYEILLTPPQNKESEMQLIALLNAYAINTCYAQAPQGFEKCACFLQFSLSRSLTLLGLLNKRPVLLPLTLDTLETELLQEKHLLQIWNESLDPGVLFSKAHELSSSIKNALVYLAYSYQNIDLFKISSSNNLVIHTKLNAFAKPFLDAKESVDFAYNREPFMITLENPNATDKRRQCYLDLIKQFHVVLPEEEAKGKEAQILNMLGLTVLREGGPVSTAREHFQQAEAIRSINLKNAIPQQLSNEKHLYANLLSSLIYCLCAENNQNAAKPHYEWLKNYVIELKSQENQHCYLSSYTQAMEVYTRKFP